jgi:hypothetical protein
MDDFLLSVEDDKLRVYNVVFEGEKQVTGMM